MNEASFASLSPTLLARKGGARPAMRPQHGGMLGSIGPATGQGMISEESLDDLGWNDMGDENAPHDDADVIRLNPAPMNQEAAARSRQMDEQAHAELAEFPASSSPARDQQEVLAKRIDRKSPPILSDAIMSNDDDADDTDDADDGYSDAGMDGFARSGVDTDHAKPQAVAAGTSRPARAQRIAAVDQGKRAAFTLRLDAERHLQLRLASTICGLSAQQIVTEALDAFLAERPEFAALASQVKRPGSKNI